MRVSDEEHSVGDGVYSRCPRGNYDVLGHTPVSHPEDLLFAWGPSLAGSVGVAVCDPVPSWRPINVCGVFCSQCRVRD